MRSHFPRALTVTIAGLLSLACLRTAAAQSQQPAGPSGTAPLIINVHMQNVDTKLGTLLDVWYEAELQADLDAGSGVYRGSGTYRGMALRVLCRQEEVLERETKPLSGRLESEATVIELMGKRRIMYSLKTLDWPYGLNLHVPESEEERQEIAGLGMTFHPGLELDEGPVTRKTLTREVYPVSCGGGGTGTTDISIGARLHRCATWEGRTGPVGGHAEALRLAVIGAVYAHHGYSGHPSMVTVQEGAGGLLEFGVPLGRRNRPLPNRECIQAEAARGNVPEGSEEGASRMLIGALQQAGSVSRVTARIVEVETGVVHQTGRGDGSGTGPAAITEAALVAIDALGVRFSP